MRSKNIVYSTDTGRLCPDCGQPRAACHCKSKGKEKGKVTPAPASDGIVRLARQSKGRAGKPVVIVTGLPHNGDELKALAKTLKQKCGVGGTVEGNNIVIQGDMREKIKAELEKLGHQVKLSGG